MTFKNQTITAEEPVNLDQVMDSLRRLDARNKKLMHWMYIAYVVFALIYTGLLILNPDPDLTLSNRIQGVIYVLIFGMSALYFRYHFKKNKAVDYSAPVLEMLTAARKRHKLWTKGTVSFIVALVGVTDIVVTWAILDDKLLQDSSLIIRILVIQAGYFLVMGISFLIGYISWRRKSMPLVRNLTRIIEELGREA
jgi:type IV secretory pathway VirB2 component (pilin)